MNEVNCMVVLLYYFCSSNFLWGQWDSAYVYAGSCNAIFPSVNSWAGNEHFSQNEKKVLMKIYEMRKKHRYYYCSSIYNYYYNKNVDREQQSRINFGIKRTVFKRNAALALKMQS